MSAYSSYVRRTRKDGKVSWTGPIRSARQAEREAQAWRETGEWSADVMYSTPEVRATVRAWVQDRPNRMRGAS